MAGEPFDERIGLGARQRPAMDEDSTNAGSGQAAVSCARKQSDLPQAAPRRIARRSSDVTSGLRDLSRSYGCHRRAAIGVDHCADAGPVPGYVCVIAERPVEEPFELSDTEAATFWRETMAVAKGAPHTGSSTQDELRDSRQHDPAPARPSLRRRGRAEDRMQVRRIGHAGLFCFDINRFRVLILTSCQG